MAMLPNIVILTAPRPNGVSYLEDTINFVMRDLCSPYPVVRVHYDTHQSCNLAFKDILVQHCQEFPGRDLVFCEDDYKFTKNAMPRIIKTEVLNDCGFVTWFDGLRCPRNDYPEKLVPTISVKPANGNIWCMGVQRHAWRFVEWMVERWPTNVHPKYMPHRWHPHFMDTILSRMLEDSPWPKYGVALPNLVEHIGEVSGYQGTPDLSTRGPGLRANNYPGDSYDALAAGEYRIHRKENDYEIYTKK
jgi:hypothetical protein